MNDYVTLLIKDYVKSYKVLKGTESNWREPIIGIASAADPMFSDLKDLISTSHALPSDFISDAKSIIAFFLPFRVRVSKDTLPSTKLLIFTL